MPTLLEALSDGSYDLNHKRDLSTDFSKKLMKYRDEVVNDYYKYNISLNTLISKIAKRDGLNDEQIKRIIEEVNNQVYLIEYAKLKNENDRTVRFEVADISKIKLSPSKDSDSKEDGEKKDGEKVAMEKTASETSKANIFNGTSYKIGGIKIAESMTKEEYMFSKIASTVENKKAEVEKIAASLEKKAAILGDTLIHLKKFGSDPTEVLSVIAKQAELSENEIGLIKESAEDRVGIAKMKRIVNENFELGIGDVTLTKTASEKFGLGKFSKINNSIICECNIPMMMVNDTTRVASIDDIVKMASEFKQESEKLGQHYVQYTEMMEKCAEAGLGDF